MHRLPFSKIRADYYVAITLIIMCLAKVLSAADQQKPNAAGQRWFEKGWRPTTSADYADSSVAGGGRSRTRTGAGGSGAGPISDLDESASGLGEDDEDTDTEMGSGTGSSNSRFDVGSGRDISLPPTARYSPSVPSTEEASPDTTAQPSTTASTASSTIKLTTEEVSTTTVQIVRVVTDRPTTTAGAVTTTRRTTKLPKIVVTETTSTTRRTTAEPIFTVRSTPRTTTLASPKKPSVLDDRNKSLPANFWMRPGVLAGLIGGAIAGLLAAILLVMFVVYRMRKKDEGSYALEEPKSPPTYAYAYQKAPTREFYA